nr:hypothetical protein GCM10020063_009340 [Dactylosporangium thailandense]
MDDRHAHQWLAGPASETGRQVEYTVVGLRGGIANFQTVTDPLKVYRTDAAVLAMQLEIDVADLVGQRFRCWVTPAEHGVIRSDFRRLES